VSDSPMIEVKDLTKRYGLHTAVDGLTFTVGKGDIVGFLGPNGAGKTTTMRILSCYMPATSGTARVAGCDLFTEADEVRRRIGYMPENNPLHLDMRVREYLKFRARLKGLSVRASRDRVDVVTELCGLTDVTQKIVGQLSKGFRQRVGLADALVHNPELIIQDELTIDLDPHQIRSVRQRIKDLAVDHTVIISTHILPEVEMTCNRVLIMHEGTILASDTVEELRSDMSDSGQVVAEIHARASDLQMIWEQMPEIAQYDISPMDGGYMRCSLTPTNGSDLRPVVFDAISEKGWKIRELTHSRQSLEDIFVHLTRTDQEEEY